MADGNLILVVVLLFMFGYMFWSNKKRRAAADQLAASLQVGATVVLFSGIVGKIESLDEKTITIKSAGSTLEVMRGAVRNVEAAPATQPKSSTAKSAAPKTAAKKPAAKKPAAK